MGGGTEGGHLGGDRDRTPVLAGHGADACFSRAQNYYTALNANHIAGARAVALGDVVLKPGLDFFHLREDFKALVEHEARHREQWAVGTAIGGPLAFPAPVVARGLLPGQPRTASCRYTLNLNSTTSPSCMT